MEALIVYGIYRLSDCIFKIRNAGHDVITLDRKDEPSMHVECAPEESKVDPTGVGDGFRAGFLAGLVWGLPLERCAQVGSLLATYVIETKGTQEYELRQQRFLDRLEAAYGAACAADVAPFVRCPRP